MAETLEDLLIWQRAVEFWEAVNPLLDRPAFGKNRDLQNQIRDAIDSVLSNISEGFEQPTDRGFAMYLYHSKGSAAEVRARLFIAWRRKYIEESDHQRCAAIGNELARMLAGFIKYLYRSDRKRRGTGPDTTHDSPPSDASRRLRRPQNDS